MDYKKLFPLTAQALSARCDATLKQAHHAIQGILSLAPQDRTFENTLQAADNVHIQLYIEKISSWALNNLSTDADLRAQAQIVFKNTADALVELIENNAALYAALREYTDNVHEDLNDEQSAYLKKVMYDFEKNGLRFDAEKQDRVRALKKEMKRLHFEFDSNINNAQNAIYVKREELAGCPDYFIDALDQDAAGNYKVTTDYPTYFMVMENAAISATRQALWKEFNNRAFPANDAVLRQLITLRDAWAHELGYESYAECELRDEMAKTPQRVRDFLVDLYKRCQQKARDEVVAFKKDVPSGVMLTEEGQFYPWDILYVKAYYKKTYLNLDEEAVREYFVLERTLDEMLAIFGQFLGVTFTRGRAAGLWHEDVIEVVCTNHNGKGIGTILLDLHPRPNKYSHACMETVVPAIRKSSTPVILIIGNVPKGTADRPALLSFDDVVMLFHEFGHATHGLLGATDFFGFAGTNVKIDFVETPSQLFEGWMYDPAMLKRMGKHYCSQQSLSDEIIKRIIQNQTYDMGLFIVRQVMQGMLALDLFGPGKEKDPDSLHKNLFKQYQGAYIASNEENHFYASFGHLGEYGSRYYCYMWSLVCARDMFDYIKKQGLVNEQVGAAYVQKVIGKGGSVDPEDLIRDFLGRPMQMDAFLQYIGLITTR